MLGIILSEPTQTLIQILLASAALISSFVAVAMYRNTRSKELAKQKDLDQTNKKVMNNTYSISEIQEKKASVEFVNQQVRGVYHKVDDIKSDVNYLRDKTDKIYEILINPKGKK